MSLSEFVSLFDRGFISEFSRLSGVSRVTVLKCRNGLPIRDYPAAKRLSEATRYVRRGDGYVYSAKAPPMVSIEEICGPSKRRSRRRAV